MSDLSWFGLLIYFASVAAIAFLASHAVTGKIRKGLEKYPVKKIAWALLVIGIGYWFVTVPYVGPVFDHRSNARPADIIDATTAEGRHITEHQNRIDDLEFELREIKIQMREMNQHYKTMINFLMMGIIFYGVALIFNSKKPEPTDEITRLNLDN